ncbi:MAG TPA: MFS transporter [Moraxellaceae bacterium]|nr:MFS transporter [Moraxellaceae bacterium]
MKSALLPVVPLSAFYFFYFAGLGGFMPYMGLFLKDHLGLAEKEIGQLLAFLMIARVIAPNFWGYLADKTGKRLTVVRFGSVMLTLCSLALMWPQGFWSLAFVLLAYSFFQSAIQAQFEAVTIAHLGGRGDLYSRIRLWGSIGFIVAVGLLGVLFDHVAVAWLPLCLMLTASATLIASLSVPAIATRIRAEAQERLRDILRRPAVMTFLAIHFLMQLSHAPYYSFFTLFLKEHGYSSTVIGWMWSLAVLAEVIAFFFMHRWLPRMGEQRVMLLCLLAGVLRWGVTAVAVDIPAVIWMVQLLHAATFAAFHAAAIRFIYAHFGDGHQGQGQGLYSMLWGVGVASGSWLAGMIWATHASWAFLGAAVACALGALLLWRVDFPRPSPIATSQPAI